MPFEAKGAAKYHFNVSNKSYDCKLVVLAKVSNLTLLTVGALHSCPLDPKDQTIFVASPSSHSKPLHKPFSLLSILFIQRRLAYNLMNGLTFSSIIPLLLAIVTMSILQLISSQVLHLPWSLHSSFQPHLLINLKRSTSHQ